MSEISYREREASIDFSSAQHPLSEELLTLNFGPHHPATHGVLRLLTVLEGEVIRDLKPIIGYLHTGIEKSCEDQAYWKVIPFVERMDYLAYYFNSMAYCMAVEKLIGLEGEVVRDVRPIIGYVHTGIEKTMEDKSSVSYTHLTLPTN